MRRKRSLRAEAAAVKAQEAKRRRQERTEKPGAAPYGLLWSELDRRAMAFTTSDGQLDVWTNPDMTVVTYTHGQHAVNRLPHYRRQPSLYLVSPHRSDPESQEDSDEAPPVPALPVEGRVRVVLRRGGGACGEEGEYAFRQYRLSDLPLADHRSVRARSMARKEWAQAEKYGMALRPELNFPVV